MIMIAMMSADKFIVNDDVIADFVTLSICYKLRQVRKVQQFKFI